VARALRSYLCGNRRMPDTYHWLDSPTSVINPHTFTEYTCDINLPDGHTLRRLLVAEPYFHWKRGSVSTDDQEIYVVNMRIVYGAALGAPVLYRTTRTLKHDMVCNPTGVTDVFFSQWYGADQELGINEKVQRGGFYSPAQRLRLTFAIYSTGEGTEELSGGASVPFRALYSSLDAP
jgi:hypothetical protein